MEQIEEATLTSSSHTPERRLSFYYLDTEFYVPSESTRSA